MLSRYLLVVGYQSSVAGSLLVSREIVKVVPEGRFGVWQLAAAFGLGGPI